MFWIQKVSCERKMKLHTILQNHNGSWKYHRRFGKYDGIFVGTEFYFYTCQNMVCCVSKEIVQWHSDTVLPGFNHMLTLSVWTWNFLPEVHWVKFNHRIYGSFQNICNTQISKYLVSKNRFSLKMGTFSVFKIYWNCNFVGLLHHPFWLQLVWHFLVITF